MFTIIIKRNRLDLSTLYLRIKRFRNFFRLFISLNVNTSISTNYCKILNIRSIQSIELRFQRKQLWVKFDENNKNVKYEKLNIRKLKSLPSLEYGKKY